MFVDALRQRYEAIDQVWLLGHRMSDDEHGGEWTLLAFADASTLRELRRDPSVHRDDLNLFVVTDGNRFEQAWGEPVAGELEALGWQLEDPHSATFRTNASGTETAVRVR